MKKIMAFVLSIAVIFSFAACEAGTIPSYYGKTVVSVTLADTPDYIKGETLNPADVDLRVVYDDNTEAYFTGAELGLKPGDATHTKNSYDLLNSVNYFSVVYGTNRDGKQVVDQVNDYLWPIQIAAVDVSTLDITIDPSNADKEIAVNGTIADVDLAGLTYSVEFANGNTKSIDPAKLTNVTWPITVSSFELKGSTATTGNVSVVLKDSVTNATLTSDWTLAVVSDDDPIESIDIVINDGYEIFEHGTNTLAQILSNSKLVATRESEEEETITADSVVFDDYQNTVNVQDYGRSYDVTVVYGGDTYTTTLSFDWTTDYPTAVTVAQADPNKTYTDGQTVSPADFSYTVTSWASKYDKYTDSEKAALCNSGDFTVQNAQILTGEQSTQNTGSHSIKIVWSDENLRDKVQVSGVSQVTLAKKG